MREKKVKCATRDLSPSSRIHSQEHILSNKQVQSIEHDLDHNHSHDLQLRYLADNSADRNQNGGSSKHAFREPSHRERNTNPVISSHSVPEANIQNTCGNKRDESFEDGKKRSNADPIEHTW